MKEGALIRKFKAEDRRDVTLRAPRWSDLDDMLEFINSLIEEGADINPNRIFTRDEEIDWLARHLSSLEKGRKVAVVAEVNSRFIGQVEVQPESGHSSHVGLLGISILSGHRDVGIGTELMKEAETQARTMGIKLLKLEVYSTNSRARHVYEKLGYRVVGCVPKAVYKDGGYSDSIIMVKEL